MLSKFHNWLRNYFWHDERRIDAYHFEWTGEYSTIQNDWKHTIRYFLHNFQINRKIKNEFPYLVIAKWIDMPNGYRGPENHLLYLDSLKVLIDYTLKWVHSKDQYGYIERHIRFKNKDHALIFKLRNGN